jgi:hypothetical protein
MKTFALIAALLIVGCTNGTGPGGKVVAHTESDKKDVFDSGRTREENTTVRNDDGSVSKKSVTETKTPPAN